MVTEDDNISIPIVTDPKPADDGLKQVENRADQAAKKVQGSFDKAGKDSSDMLAGYFKTAFGAIATYFTATAIKGFVEDSVKEAIQADSAVLQLNNTLALNGAYSQKAAEEMQEYVNSLEQLTGVGDDVINNGAALLAQIGRLSGEGLKRATGDALDLAKGLGVDVNTAFMLVGKAAEGNVSAFSRFGMKIDDTGTKAEVFERVLQTIESRMHGIASSAADTVMGALTRITTNFGNLKEAIGELFLQSGGFKAFLKVIADGFERATTTVQKFGAQRDVIGNILLILIDLGRGLTQFVIRPLELVYNVAKTVWYGVLQILNLFAREIARLGVDLGRFISYFNKDMGDSLAQTSSLIAQYYGEDMVDAAAKGQDALVSMFDFSTTDAADKFLTSMHSAVQGGLGVVETTAATIKNAVSPPPTAQSDWAAFFGAFMKGAQTTAQAAAQLGQTLKGTLVSGVTNAFQQVGAALVTGKNALNEFGKAMLGMLGQLAIQVGSFLIFAGLGFSALPFGLSGAAAVGFGAALIVLGGALMALSGGGAAVQTTGQGPASAGSGGGVTFSPESQQSQLSDETPVQPSTQINVTVQGNVLDRRQSGLEIVEIINEAFDSQGLTFARSYQS